MPPGDEASSGFGPTKRPRRRSPGRLTAVMPCAKRPAAVSWDQIRSMPHHLEALPLGLVVLVALFVTYAWSKTNEISELRGLVRGIEQQQSSAEQDSDQLDQLFSLISKSQQGYRDLIDTFEDLLFSIT